MLERASVERGGGGEMWHQEGARIFNKLSVHAASVEYHFARHKYSCAS